MRHISPNPASKGRLTFSLLLVFAVLVQACNSSASTVISSGDTSPGAFSLTMFVEPSRALINPLVLVSVGGSDPLALVFDTGSPGLRVFRPFIGPKVTDTHVWIEPPPHFGSSGTERLYEGTVGTADVVVGGIDIGKQTLEIVKKVCYEGSPPPLPVRSPPGFDCNPTNMRTEIQRNHFYGIFGVDPTEGVYGIYSLMSEMPGAQRNGFVVSLRNGANPKVELGVPQDLSSFKTTAEGVSVSQRPDGSYYWNTKTFPWYYSLKGTALQDAELGSVLTDSGGQSAHLYFPVTTPAPTGMPWNTLTPLPAGLKMTAILGRPGSSTAIRWAFTTGKCLYNTVRVWYGAGSRPPPNTRDSNGINPYFDFDVLYDLKDGLLGFRRSHQGPPSFC